MINSPLVRFPQVAIPLNKIDEILRADDGTAYVRRRAYANTTDERTQLGCSFDDACKAYNDALVAQQQIQRAQSVAEQAPMMAMLKRIGGLGE